LRAVAELLADECVDVQLVFRLRRLGHTVRTVREFCTDKGGDGFDDEAVLALAVEHRLAVLSSNETHFVALHRSHPGHYGILVVEVESDVRSQARRIHDALKDAGDLRGRLLWLTIAATTPVKTKRRKKRGGWLTAHPVVPAAYS
jgi:hypothetical protein